MDASANAVAVIVDVSKSRSHSDRRELQRQIEQAFGRVNDLVAADQPLQPTVGDEFQAAYADLGTALSASLRARLALPEGVDCRFGLGLGELAAIGTGVAGVLQDGSAWWAARRAIDEARKHEYSKLGFVRTWFRAAEPTPTEALVNAYLLGRDQIVSAMNARARRLLLGQLLGETQGVLAQKEGITQSAVSQNLARSGANAVIAGEALLLETTGVFG
ncbi:SatD family protein [Conyzicola sp.]|uniref:SatD family protein n=1 Tax=Conyzicola sp. TaxID=1969404 RepID=UPI00398948DA